MNLILHLPLLELGNSMPNPAKWKIGVGGGVGEINATHVVEVLVINVMLEYVYISKFYCIPFPHKYLTYIEQIHFIFFTGLANAIDKSLQFFKVCLECIKPYLVLIDIFRKIFHNQKS